MSEALEAMREAYENAELRPELDKIVEAGVIAFVVVRPDLDDESILECVRALTGARGKELGDLRVSGAVRGLSPERLLEIVVDNDWGSAAEAWTRGSRAGVLRAFLVTGKGMFLIEGDGAGGFKFGPEPGQ